VAEQEQLAAKEVTEPATETEAPTNAGEEQAAEEVNEPEEKQMTLDEWKAMQDRNRVRAAFNIRKAGEGVSAQPEWKKMFVLKKKVEEHGEEEEEEEEEEEDDARAKHKTQVPIQIKFNDTGARGGFGRRGGRGGRGGGPGRRPEGGEEPRRGRSEKVDVVPNVDNELDFPSLA
jgi:plasminogen activator inhibitor 1 RNA-binding protein